MFISEDVLAQVREANNIVQIVSEYISLRKAGRNFKARCPFHQEKTPSFVVSPEKEIFHCFGCGAGGNVFHFLMQIENLTFPEAVKKLAGKAGINIPESYSFGEDKKDEKQIYYDFYQQAADFYHRCLKETSEGTVALEYLKKRGIKDWTIEQFKLGYAPANGNALLSAATKKGCAVEKLEKSGLVKQGTNGTYDCFRGRIIFPIADRQGRVVAFGGRIIDETDKNLPKYINSSESLIYSKGKMLYGLPQAALAIRRENKVILCEGYTDVIFLHQVGIENAVGVLGTSLTTEQTQLLSRWTEEVIVLFDSDPAGLAAAERSIDLLWENSIGVRVAILPPNLDADEYLIRHGKENFNKLLEQSLPFFEFYFKEASRKENLTGVEGRVNCANRILPHLSRIKNLILQKEYIRTLAEKLSLDEESLSRELARLRGKNNLDYRAADISLKKETLRVKIERELIQIFLAEPRWVEELKATLREDSFSSYPWKMVWRFLLAAEPNRRTLVHLLDNFSDPEISKILSSLLENDYPHQADRDAKKIIDGLLENLGKFSLEEKKQELEEEVQLMLSGEKRLNNSIYQEYKNTLRQLKTKKGS